MHANKHPATIFIDNPSAIMPEVTFVHGLRSRAKAASFQSNVGLTCIADHNHEPIE